MSKYKYFVENEGCVGTIVADNLADALSDARDQSQDGEYPDDGCEIQVRLENTEDPEDATDWEKVAVHPKWVVTTDGFQSDDFRAADLDSAIEYAFDGEGLGKIVDENSLQAKFAKYVEDGGWCWIERAGVRVLEIGDC